MVSPDEMRTARATKSECTKVTCDLPLRSGADGVREEICRGGVPRPTPPSEAFEELAEREQPFGPGAVS